MDLTILADILATPMLGKALWLWVLFLGAVGTILVLDLGLFNRKDHAIDVKESLRLTGVYVALGLLFGLWVYYKNGGDSALDYYTVYLLEQSLSLDNLFVMSVIFASLRIPREYQHRILVWGIIGVILMRGAMIATGAALVESYGWVLFIFAGILIYTGFRMLTMNTDDDENYADKPYVKFMARHMRISDRLHGNRFFVKIQDHNTGKYFLYATPLFLALCVIEITDLLFAFDSVPAALAITTDAYVVITANIFAILGLRAMFFAMQSVLHRFSYLKYSLSIVLMFIGAKVFYAHYFGKMPPAISLGVTISVLALGIVISLIRTKNEPNKGAE